MSAEKWVQNDEGWLELIDEKTGVVIIREKRKQPPRRRRSIRVPGRPSKTELAQTAAVAVATAKRRYEPEAIAAKICNAIADGADLRALPHEQGFPPQAVITRLRREDASFDRRVREALEAQAFILAMILEEKAMTVVEDAKLRGDPQASRLAVEVFRWLAERNDPARYCLKRGRGRPRKTLLASALTVLRASATDAPIK